jgi:hypothetical protein
MPVHVLSHDDRVVDEQPQHRDEGEERDQIDGDAEHWEQPEGAEEGERHPEADPECESQAQGQREHHEDEDEAAPTVADQDVEPIAERLRLVSPDREVHALRHALAGSRDVLAHRAHELEDALLPHPIDLDQHRGLAIEVGEPIVVLESVHYARHIAQQESRTVGAGQHDDALELLAPVRLPLGAQQHFAAARLDRASRQIERAAAHGLDHLIEGETVAAQRLLGNLDRDLVVARAAHLHLGDTGQRGDLVARSLAEHLERPL